MSAPLRLIPKSTVVPILQGPLRGRRWIVDSGISRLWLGSYEPEKMTLAASLLNPGDVAFDIGANVGIYTLLFGAAVGPTGHVVAFEPWPRNLLYLRQHLALNDVANASVLGAAVCRKTGRVMLAGGEHPATVRVLSDGDIEVDSIRLDDFVEATKIEPDLIKIDVEGSEVDVLNGASATLRKAVPLLLIATHSPALKTACTELLEDHGYVVTAIGLGAPSDEIVARPRSDAPNRAGCHERAVSDT
jgi:FkbM family methyltransferase